MKTSPLKPYSSLSGRNHRLAVFFVLLILITATAAALAADYAVKRQRILDLHYHKGTIQKMRRDAKPIFKKFNGLNVFSTFHYGTGFVTGDVTIGDVFDARIPENMEIFKRFAKKRRLVANVPERLDFNRYSKAGITFMRDLGYDAVLFYPDEFNPVFTRPDDTWMFIREEPLKKPTGSKYYYSGRIINRRLEIIGGIPMEQSKIIGFADFYVPLNGSIYEPFRIVESETIETSAKPGNLNPRKKVTVTRDMIKKREELGIRSCDLSNIKIRVGTWVPDEDAQHRLGLRFTGDETVYTWSDCGVYVLPLDVRFRSAAQKNTH